MIPALKMVRFLAVGLLTLMVASCSAPPPIDAPDGVEITPLKTYSVWQSRFLLWIAGVRPVRVEYAVDTYRVIYKVAEPDGRQATASGLLALPRGGKARRIVSFQHGTATNRENVPSRLDMTGVAASVLFAGNGYALMAPDYIGLGDSPGPHAYLVAADEARAAIGLIDVAKALPGAPQGPAFLSGFSQGGHATLATVRELEARGERVFAAAPVAGAYDLRHISLPAALKGGAKSHAVYLAYMAWGYAHYYGHPLDSALTPEYAALVEGLFGSWKACSARHIVLKR